MQGRGIYVGCDKLIHIMILVRAILVILNHLGSFLITRKYSVVIASWVISRKYSVDSNSSSPAISVALSTDRGQKLDQDEHWTLNIEHWTLNTEHWTVPLSFSSFSVFTEFLSLYLLLLKEEQWWGISQMDIGQIDKCARYKYPMRQISQGTNRQIGHGGSWSHPWNAKSVPSCLSSL